MQAGVLDIEDPPSDLLSFFILSFKRGLLQNGDPPETYVHMKTFYISSTNEIPFKGLLQILNLKTTHKSSINRGLPRGIFLIEYTRLITFAGGIPSNDPFIVIKSSANILLYFEYIQETFYGSIVNRIPSMGIL